MGIRFQCQYCQRRLNVKNVQAGQHGQCPSCNNMVRVPLESTVVSRAAKSAVHSKSGRFSTSGSIDESEDRSQILDVDDQVTLDGVVAGEHDRKPKSGLAKRIFRTASVASPATADAGEAFMLGRPSPAQDLDGQDPILSAPKKVWYFRTRGFGEKGPIKGREMRESIDHGEVTAGSKVWREDWDDWVAAEEVFPEIAEQARTAKRKARLDKALKDAGMDQSADKGKVAERTPEQLKQMEQRKVMFWIAGVGLAIVFALVLVVIKLVANG